MEIISGKRYQDLTSAAKLAEARKDQSDRFLDPQVGIKPEPIVAVPDIADRNTQAQFSPARFGAGRVKHARSQDAQLELADAALHAQQQSIVRTTGIVHPVEINDARFNQAAQLEEMVPIPSVAGKARCVEAEHCTDLARAQAAHQSFETRTVDSAAGGTTKVIIDHIDIAEAPATRNIDKLILPPLALQIVLDLTWGGLSNVDHSLALQHCGGKEVIARHRSPPSPRRRPRPSEGLPAWRQRRSFAHRSGHAFAVYRTVCSVAGSALAMLWVVVIPSWRASWMAVSPSLEVCLKPRSVSSL